MFIRTVSYQHRHVFTTSIGPVIRHSREEYFVNAYAYVSFQFRHNRDNERTIFMMDCEKLIEIVRLCFFIWPTIDKKYSKYNILFYIIFSGHSKILKKLFFIVCLFFVVSNILVQLFFFWSTYAYLNGSTFFSKLRLHLIIQLLQPNLAYINKTFLLAITCLYESLSVDWLTDRIPSFDERIIWTLVSVSEQCRYG